MQAYALPAANTRAFDDVRHRRYVGFLLDAIRLWAQSEVLAPAMGMTAAELFEDGRHMWQRSRFDDGDALAELRDVAEGDPSEREGGLEHDVLLRRSPWGRRAVELGLPALQ